MAIVIASLFRNIGKMPFLRAKQGLIPECRKYVEHFESAAAPLISAPYFTNPSNPCNNRSISFAWISPIVEIRNSSADSPPCPA